ncbi:MAG TPA: multicopper oxidase domain-containing protein [Blastocatellia bacterium]|nr:multicopper oxidase domain-containing protein [Blastocatellia bacterium]
MSRKKAKDNKSERKGFELTRRDMLKMGGAAGAATVLGPMVLTSRKSYNVYAQGVPSEPVLCTPEPDFSPPTTPFRDELPIIFPAIPKFLNPAPTKNANIAGGEAARDPHQRWEEFLPDLTYELTAKPGLHRFHADYEPSYVWGFDGKYPAPTILNAYGHPTLVRFRNQLPANTSTFGRNEITIHLHNGHTASESDGFAGDFFGTGLFKDNHYANAYAGIDAFGGIGDPREFMHTFWYHDHRAAFTANNNYMGLNGFYLAYNETDPGHEFNTPGSFRLPNYYGITDIPLIFTDKVFCPTANGRTEMFNEPGDNAPGGDKWVVNGKIQPFFKVRRRKYRFRLLNSGPVKTWNLSFIKSDGSVLPMTVVSVDANFVKHPYQPNPITIFVASRYDVIVDFSSVPVGDHVYLKENAPQFVGVPTPDPAPGLPIENVVMRFDVVSTPWWFPPDTPPIPDPLADLPPIPEPDAFFTWTFKLVSGTFLINDLTFDPNVPVHTILQGTTEEWHLRNDVIAGNWTHPVHIHFEEGRILERTQQLNPGSTDPPVVLPLSPGEDGANARRDVYPLPGQNAVRIRMQFRDFLGRYLIHCHNMNHEDDFMMVRWDIVNSVSELQRRRRDIAERRRALGLPIEDGLPKNKRGEVI